MLSYQGIRASGEFLTNDLNSFRAPRSAIGFAGRAQLPAGFDRRAQTAAAVGGRERGQGAGGDGRPRAGGAAGFDESANELVPKLTELLGRASGQPRIARAELLWYFDPKNPAIIPALTQGMSESNSAVRAVAAYWYWKSGQLIGREALPAPARGRTRSRRRFFPGQCSACRTASECPDRFGSVRSLLPLGKAK